VSVNNSRLLKESCISGNDSDDSDDSSEVDGDFPDLPVVPDLPIHLQFYNMSHKNRGEAIIFNHRKYDSGQSRRQGTQVDGYQVKKVFEELGFKIWYYVDPTYADIKHVMKTSAFNIL
jgi:hypothetical protein